MMKYVNGMDIENGVNILSTKFLVFFFLVFALLTVPIYGAGKLDLKNEAFVEKIRTKKDGKKVKSIEPAVKVLPGEEVIFVITYMNGGDKPATDIIITNPIPKNMTYKSAAGDSDEITQVSVDGGKRFDKLEKLKIKEKKSKSRQALVGDVTHVRWILAKALPPKKKGKVRLRATLN